MPNTTFTGNAIARQKGRCGFLIFDENILNLMKADFDFRNVVFPVTYIEEPHAMMDAVLGNGYKHLFVADSIAELSEKTGIDAGGLDLTVKDYNRCCAQGYDELFNKPHKYLRPLDKPKYYAAQHFPSAYGSLGGIKINHKTEVIDKNWDVISGLYAAGNDACNIYGDSYVFVLPGNTMGFAINSGRIAAENAVKYYKTLG